MACRPFLYLAVSLSAGILLGSWLAPLPAVVIIGFLASLGTAWLAYFFKKNLISLVLALLATLFLGLNIHRQAASVYERNPLKQLDFRGYADFWGRLYRSPSYGIGRTSLFLKTEKIFFLGKEVRARGNLRVTVLHPSSYPSPLNLKTGDEVKVSAQRLSGRDFRNFGGRRTAELWKTRRIHFLGITKNIRLVEKMEPRGRLSLARTMSSLRLVFERQIEKHFSSPDGTSLSRQGAVLEALLLGERGRMDAAASRALQSSGLYHLIAISGAHIGILSLLVFAVLQTFRFRRRPSCAVLIVFLIFYALMVEGRPSVMRATIMTLTFLFGRLLWEKTDLLNTVSFSAFVLLLFHPFSLFELGFEMTYAATLSIILFYPRVSKYLSRFPMRTGELLALSLTAQLGVIPLLACFFNRVTLSSLLLNIPAIPLVGLIMGSGFTFLAFSPICPAADALLVPAIKFLVSAFLWISRVGAALPALSYRIPTPPASVVIGYYLFLLVLLLPPRFRAQRLLGFSLFSVTMAVLVTYPFPARSSSALRLTFLDVGQGDSVLVEFPGRKKMLVDGGGMIDSSFDVGEQVVSPFLWRRGIKKLDYLVLSHAHPDHLNGLVAVASNFRIAEFWEGFSPLNAPAYEQLIKSLPSLARRRRVFRGFRLRLNAVMIEALHPQESGPLERKVDNEDSLVLRLTAGGVSILLASDIGQTSEKSIIDSRADIRSQVLKSPHHGSRTSSSAAFLDAVKPRVVVISAGHRNPYGVPHPEILDRYKAEGMLCLRTDLDGAIEISLQPPGLHVRTADPGAFPD